MSNATLYIDTFSPNAWRVSIFLAEKKITNVEVKAIQLMQGDNKKPEYLALNPRGQVPTYKDDDVVISESLAILMYLEHKHHKTHPLIPTNDKDYALFLTRYFQFTAKLDNVGFLGLVLFQKKTKADLTEKIATLLKEFQQWDAALEGKEYLAGAFSLADIAIIPNITVASQILGLDLAQFPNLNAWFKRMWERPAVKDTCTFVTLMNGLPHERVLEGAKL